MRNRENKAWLLDLEPDGGHVLLVSEHWSFRKPGRQALADGSLWLDLRSLTIRGRGEEACG